MTGPGGDWHIPSSLLTIPPFMDPEGSGIIIGQSAAEGTVYPELAALYAPGVVVGAIIQQEGRFDYVYLAYVNPTVGKSFWAVGAIESVSLVLLEAFRVLASTFGAPPRFQVAALSELTQVTVSGKPVSGSGGDVFHVFANIGNTASVAYVDYPGPVEITLDKDYDGGAGGTDVKIHVEGTCYSNAGDGVEFAVREAGVDYSTTAAIRLANGMLNSHTTFAGGTRIHNLAAGSHTFRLRWRTTTGADVRVDNNDTLAFSAWEVAA